MRKFKFPPGSTDGMIERYKYEIERLREYACHRFECAKIKDAVAKCDCGLVELLSSK